MGNEMPEKPFVWRFYAQFQEQKDRFYCTKIDIKESLKDGEK